MERYHDCEKQRTAVYHASKADAKRAGLTGGYAVTAQRTCVSGFAPPDVFPVQGVITAYGCALHATGARVADAEPEWREPTEKVARKPEGAHACAVDHSAPAQGEQHHREHAGYPEGDGDESRGHSACPRNPENDGRHRRGDEQADTQHIPSWAERFRELLSPRK